MPFTQGDVGYLQRFADDLNIPMLALAGLMKTRIIEPGEAGAAAEEACRNLHLIEDYAELLAEEVREYICAFEETPRLKGVWSGLT
jgi:hypothetical protein